MGTRLQRFTSLRTATTACSRIFNLEVAISFVYIEVTARSLASVLEACCPTFFILVHNSVLCNLWVVLLEDSTTINLLSFPRNLTGHQCVVVMALGYN